MKLIPETHVHTGISKEWLESLPTASEFKITINESETTGMNNCVPTEEKSVIYWMRRDNRKNLSRMTSQKAVETNKVITVECPENGKIVLATAYYGDVIADKEPFQEDWTAVQCEQWVKHNPDSFWAKHGLVEEPTCDSSEDCNKS